MKRLILIIACALALTAVSSAADMNVTPSPDGTMEAFTRNGDLWVRTLASGRETRLTSDGSDVILNGYASWVYYEEILGRPSEYRAFWWSPDSRKIGFYRFDNSLVPMFPIYSPFGQDGSLSRTRYPKAGERNPEVRIGMVDLDRPAAGIVWADFDNTPDQYFGIPFWGADSKEFYIAREPRRQSVLDLYAVSASDGTKRHVYHEEYEAAWLDWIEEVVFTPSGLYMARNFETGWEQIYFLSYDGRTFRRLTDGENWGISILKVDEGSGNVWFIAKRDSRLHPSVYRLDAKGTVTPLTDPAYWAKDVEFAPDGKTLTAKISTSAEPWRTVRVDAFRGFRKSMTVLESEPADTGDMPSPKVVTISHDGFELYGLMSLPRNFKPAGKYPVVMQLYGGPGTPYVRDRWADRDASDRWCFDNGVIYIVVDPRSSGENGRRGMDCAFKQMTVTELSDYVAWAAWLQSLPYVDGSRIGVEGFSFGGTTTAMLVLRYPRYFCCGIAGGGVYDWKLYDSHYTERFMLTPEENPDGYAIATVLNHVSGCKPRMGGRNGLDPVLKLTHGTGDDNVHFQNTLQLCDALQKAGWQFELMIYPDGMHGYRGAQRDHDRAADAVFWTKHLLW